MGSDGPKLGGRTSWVWKPVLTVAHPKADKQTWKEIFALLPGHPIQMTCDDDSSLMNAAWETWPLNPATGEAEIWINYCLYHLAEGFRSEFTSQMTWLVTPNGPTGDKRAKRLWDAFNKMSEGPDQWWEFVQAAKGLNPTIQTRVNRWLNRGMRAEYVLDQLAPQGKQAATPNAPTGSAKLKTLTRGPGANAAKWMDTISRALTASGGQATQPLRTVCEPAGHSGLR